MKPTAAMHKALSIAGVPTDKDLTPESVEKMLGLLVEKTTAGEKAATELATTKTALETERVRAEKAEKALATGTQVGEAVAAKALSVDATSPLFKRSQKARDEGHKALLDAHAAKGRLTEPMRAAVGKLLSVEFGYALDATGSAKSVAVEDEVRTLLDAIPVDAVVPLKQRLTALSAAPAVSAPGAGGSEDPKETAKRMLAAVQ